MSLWPQWALLRQTRPTPVRHPTDRPPQLGTPHTLVSKPVGVKGSIENPAPAQIAQIKGCRVEQQVWQSESSGRGMRSGAQVSIQVLTK